MIFVVIYAILKAITKEKVGFETMTAVIPITAL